MSQTTFSNAPALGRAGLVASNLPSETISKIADGAVRVGHAVVRGTDLQSGIHPGDCKMPGALGAVVNTVATTTASAATPLVLTSGAGLAAGAARLSPARKVTLVLNSHADWDATTATIKGLSDEGEFVSETVAIPNNGNVTLTTNNVFSSVTEIDIPAQTGTGGSFTAGVAAGDAEYVGEFLGIAMYDATREPYGSSFDDYADKDSVPVLIKGDIWVKVEAAVVDGQQAFFRTNTVSTDVAGQFSGAGGAGFQPVLNGNFQTAASALGLALLRLK